MYQYLSKEALVQGNGLLYRPESDIVAKVLRKRLNTRTRGAWPQSAFALRVIMSGWIERVVGLIVGVQKKLGRTRRCQTFAEHGHVNSRFCRLIRHAGFIFGHLKVVSVGAKMIQILYKSPLCTYSS